VTRNEASRRASSKGASAPLPLLAGRFLSPRAAGELCTRARVPFAVRIRLGSSAVEADTILVSADGSRAAWPSPGALDYPARRSLVGIIPSLCSRRCSEALKQLFRSAALHKFVAGPLLRRA